MDSDKYRYYEYDGNIPGRERKDRLGFPERFVGGKWVEFQDLERWETTQPRSAKKNVKG